MGIKEIQVGRADMYRIDPRVLVEEEGWNVRLPSDELTAHIRKLANSIKEIGVQVPLKICMKGEVPTVVNGHCRLAATMLAISEGAEVKSIPVVMEERNCSKEDRTFSMITCNEGRPLSVFEKAEVYKRLVGWGWGIDDIARKAGYSETHVASCLTLAAAHPEIRKMVMEGKVSATLALKLMAEFGEEAALKQMAGAVETAEKVGKKKATKKDVGERIPKEGVTVKVNWKKLGPMLFHALEAIVTCPAKGKGSERMGDYLAAGNEVIQLVEDEGYRKE